jgi:hypothetical protein
MSSGFIRESLSKRDSEQSLDPRLDVVQLSGTTNGYEWCFVVLWLTRKV